MSTGQRTNRLPAIALATVGAVIVVIVLLVGNQDEYQINAVFEDAGQLVTGGQVQVAGRTVGSIARLTLTADGLAEVHMSIGDDQLVPFHQGTRAIIRALGQAGVDNRIVQLVPGPQTAPVLHSGAVLPATQTTGIVDLDAVLDTFDPGMRSSVRQLIASSSSVFAGSGATAFNQVLRRIDPAVSELAGLSGQIAADRTELTQLVQTGAVAVAAVASRRSALEGAVANAATTFAELRSSRTALIALLDRAPRALDEAGGTLSRLASTVQGLEPTLRAVVPVGRPLERVLAQAPGTLGGLTPVLRTLDGDLGPLRATLTGVRPLAGPAVQALRALTVALTHAMPILVGTREYGADAVLGLFNGLGGLISGDYTSQGHYAALQFVQSPQTLSAGLGSALLSQLTLLPGVLNERTRLLARCPGGDGPPAPDGSNPWIPSKGLCNPSDDVPLSVDFP